MDFEKILKIMEIESKERDAPVYRFEESARSTPFRALVSVMLSSRTKDETTLQATEKLFSKIKTPKELLKLKVLEIEKLIYGVGFYKTKAKRLIEISKILIEKFNSKVPSTLEELVTLPGVGRKTANIVLSIAFGKVALGVDVHVHRISNRMGLVRTKKPEQTETELIKKVPKKYIRKLNRIFVAYGQTICTPKKPKCPKCKLNKICPKIGVNQPE